MEVAELPQEVTDHARLIVLDTLGAIIAGIREDPVARLARALATGSSGPATVPGTSVGVPASLAAFVNGTAGTWNELDEGNYPTHQHPAIHVVPAALALAEELDQDGARLLAAIVAGYEIAGRVGRATKFRDDVMHPHGTHGTIGGAIACGLLLRLGPRELAELVNVSSSMTVATSRPTVFEGATVRNSYAGQANQNAVLAARMCEAGFTGERDGLSSIFGKVSGVQFDPDSFVFGLGTDFILTQNYFKFHACCAYNHATLEALRRLVGDVPIDPQQVVSIDVATYFPATRMTRTDVANQLAAKFSIPYAVAAMIVLGDCGPRSFVEPALSNPEIRELVGRVHVSEDPEATARYPAKQQARVLISLRDGSRREAAVDTVRGDFADAVPPSEIQAKFRDLTTPVLGADRARLIISVVQDLGRGTGARDLGRALRSVS